MTYTTRRVLLLIIINSRLECSLTEINVDIELSGTTAFLQIKPKL
jgi:hypothetical protein